MRRRSAGTASARFLVSTFVLSLGVCGTLPRDTFAEESSRSTSLAAASYRQNLVGGNFLIFEFVRDYFAAFKSGDRVIIGYQDGETHTKLIGTLKTAAYPNSSSEILDRNLISLWGAKFSLEERDEAICLVLFGTCYAHLKGQLFDSEFSRGQYFRIINGTLSEMLYVRNVTYSEMCRVNGVAVYPTYAKYRALGEIFFRAVRLLDLIPYVATHDAYVEGIEKSIDTIRTGYTRDFSKTAYHTCFNVSELMTGYLVVRGLNEYYAYTKDSDLRNYMVQILTDIYSSDHAKTVRNEAGNAPTTNVAVFANTHAQYLHILLLREELGVAPLPIHADGVVKNIIYAQSLNASGQSSSFRHNQHQCREFKPDGVLRSLTFGGWAHSVHLSEGFGDCRQSMGYHILTTDPLLSMHHKIQHSSLCMSSSFSYMCQQLRWSLRASIAHFALPTVSNPSGMFFGHNLGSVSDAKFEQGNSFGGTSHVAVDFYYRALPSISWGSTPGGFNGERVSKTDIELKFAQATDYVWLRNRDFSYLASFAYSRLIQLL